MHWEFHGYAEPRRSEGRRSWYGLYRQKGAAWRMGADLDDAASLELARHAGAVASVVQPFAGLGFEGGAIVCDGQGTGIVVEEIVRRSGAKSKEDLEAQLRLALGLEKLLWIPHGLTPPTEGGNAHADMVAAFCGPGQLLLSVAARGDEDSGEAVRLRANQEALRHATDARGRPITVTPLPLAEVSWLDRALQRKDMALGNWYGQWLERTYANVMFVDGAVLVPQYGDAHGDAEALHVVDKVAAAGGLALEAVPVPLREISRLGGGLRCLSLPVPC